MQDLKISKWVRVYAGPIRKLIGFGVRNQVNSWKEKKVYFSKNNTGSPILVLFRALIRIKK